jgi:uncharacterized OsmC-like protein
MADPVVYRSQVRIERVKGPLRRAYLPVEEEPVLFGVHSEVAEHYGVDPQIHAPHATTLDYLVAAAAGWLTGTFGGALEARQIPAGEDRLSSTTVGEIEQEDGVLVVRRIHVTYQLKLLAEQREAAERAHRVYAERCPVYRTIHRCVEITSSLEMEEL